MVAVNTLRNLEHFGFLFALVNWPGLLSARRPWEYPSGLTVRKESYMEFRQVAHLCNSLRSLAFSGKYRRPGVGGSGMKVCVKRAC